MTCNSTVTEEFLFDVSSFQPQLAISEGVSSSDMLSLQLYLGVAFCVGSAAVGAVVINNSTECRIARQYLCQASLAVCALSIYALAAIRKAKASKSSVTTG